MLKELRKAEVKFAKNNYEYVEKFSFDYQEVLKKDVITAKLGDKVVFTAPELKDKTVASYYWKVNGSNEGYSVEKMTDTNTFTIENVDVRDFGQVTCTMIICNHPETHTT